MLVVGSGLFILAAHSLLTRNSRLSGYEKFRELLVVGFGAAAAVAAWNSLQSGDNFTGVDYGIFSTLLGVWVLTALPALVDKARQNPSSLRGSLWAFVHVLFVVLAVILGTYWVVSGAASIFGVS
jgi:hypothetical protein